MSVILLEAKAREGNSKGYTKQLRANGFIPGVIYGRNKAALKIFLTLKELEQALTHGGAKKLLTINLSNNEGQAKVPAMIKEMQTHPLKGVLTHVDLYQVDLKEKVVAEIAVNLTGEPQGVKEGGILQQQIRALEVECLPTEIPDSISFDITNLAIGDQLLVQDLPVLAGVELITEGEKVVANIVMPRVEVEPTAEDAGEAVDLPEEEIAGGEAEAEPEQKEES